MRRYVILWLGLGVSCGIFEPSPGDPRGDLRAELLAREAEWKSHNIHNYDFEYRRDCVCGADVTQVVSISVRNDVITSVRNTEGAEITSPLGIWPTVDSLFLWGKRFLDDPRPLVGFAYNDTLDYPIYISADILSMQDDQVAHNASSLVAVLPSIGPAGADSAGSAALSGGGRRASRGPR
jgi:hypothetical protein